MSAIMYSGIGKEIINLDLPHRVRLAADLGSGGHVFAYAVIKSRAVVKTELALTLYISASPHRSYPLWTTDSALELVGWRLLDWLPGRSEERLLVDPTADALTVQVSEDGRVTLKVRDINTDEAQAQISTSCSS